METEHIQNELDNNSLGDINPFIAKCIPHQIHIWHELNASGDFVPYSDITIEKALSIVEKGVSLYQMTVVHIAEAKVAPFVHYFTMAFSLGGMYTPLSFTSLIVPKRVNSKVNKYIDTYGLSNYRDLVWFLIARLQVFYTQRICFGVLSEENYTSIIYKSREHFTAIQRLVQYLLERETMEKKNPLTITIKQKGYKHVIDEGWILQFLFSGFMREFLYENGKLIPSWKHKIASFEGSHAIKNDLEHIHLNFAIAYIKFLAKQNGVKDTKLSSRYLNPIVDILNISQYPFINDGDVITSRHLKSILKNTTYVMSIK